MTDVDVLKVLLRDAFEAGREQGMKDIHAIISGTLSTQAPDAASDRFFADKQDYIKKIISE